jgi:hypothetical protein
MPTDKTPAVQSPMSDVLATLKTQIAALDTTENRAELAHVGRAVLQKLTPLVVAAVPNSLLRAGLTLAFSEIDEVLAKIEAGTTPAIK